VAPGNLGGLGHSAESSRRPVGVTKPVPTTSGAGEPGGNLGPWLHARPSAQLEPGLVLRASLGRRLRTRAAIRTGPSAMSRRRSRRSSASVRAAPDWCQNAAHT
jgi:hypothetical protein